MPGIRVTGGGLRGRKVPLPRGVELRPTSDRARQAYFNIVRPRLDAARFLDLFCGTGIFSIEAISRGAREAVALDVSRKATAALSDIAKSWDLPIRAIPGALPGTLVSLAGSEPFDLVYCDPPYDFPSYPQIARAVESNVELTPDTIVAFEHRAGSSPFEGETLETLEHQRTERYGNVAISFFAVRKPETRT
jgi:16S rRNA (guanine966-N2)-methyltransferase